MILLWGIDNDPPLQKVRNALNQKGINTFFLDHRKIQETRIKIDFPSLDGSIWIENQRLNLCNISAAYFRPYDLRKYTNFKLNSEDF